MQKILLGLIFATLPAFPAYSEDVCYMIRENGKQANLDHICGTLAQQSLSIEQRYLIEYKATVSRMRNADLLIKSANAQPDVTIGLAKEVCRVLRSGGDKRAAAGIWVQSMSGVSDEMRDAISDDAAATITVAPKHFCPDQASKI